MCAMFQQFNLILHKFMNACFNMLATEFTFNDAREQNGSSDLPKARYNMHNTAFVGRQHSTGDDPFVSHM